MRATKAAANVVVVTLTVMVAVLMAIPPFTDAMMDESRHNERPKKPKSQHEPRLPRI